MSKAFAGKRRSGSRAQLSHLASSAGRSVRNGANVGEPESFSSQNEPPMKPVRAAKNIFTSGENTYWKACIGRNEATLKISILIPLLVGAARSLVERTRHQMAVLQILREQTELADSDRYGRAVFPILPYCLLCLSLVPCREGRAGLLALRSWSRNSNGLWLCRQLRS
jgi:hypothetical protein